MPAKIHRNKTEAVRADENKARRQRDKDWDERLRTVGAARFVEVEWSGKDHPVWPLPKR